VTVDAATDVPTAVRAAGGRGVLARGLGRSYGDAAQNAGGRVLAMTGAAGTIEIDDRTGVATIAAGTSIDELLRVSVPRGWFVPVTPGTRAVTIGGAIAADVHGKNHHRDGSFGCHVRALDLVQADGTTTTIGPELDPEAFWATVGGMGLTGVVTRAEVLLRPIETSRILVDTTRAADLDALMGTLGDADARHRYSVAWIDLLATGDRLGRGVVTAGDHAPLAALDRSDHADARAFAPSVRLGTPGWVPPGLLNRASVRAFNELWFRKAPRERRDEVQSLGAFFHPLDGVRDWNRLYGPAGFLQHQFVVPFGGEATLRTIIELFAASGAPSFLAVLKRFGPADAAPLSFPMPGWTLALDLPAATSGLAELLDGVDRLVADAGGRLYLAKDARLDPGWLTAMYPRLDEWRATRDRLDPDRRMMSDLARRLDLLGPAPMPS
jgi:decaprenylphospho-beta-D-ribofuranose 2-oxidase